MSTTIRMKEKIEDLEYKIIMGILNKNGANSIFNFSKIKKPIAGRLKNSSRMGVWKIYLTFVDETYKLTPV